MVGSSGIAPTSTSSLEILEEAVTTILSTLDLEQVLERIADLLHRRFGVERVSIRRILPDDPGQAELLLVRDPTGAGHLPGARVPLPGSAFGEAAATREPVVLADLDPDHPRFREEALLGRAGYRTLVCFPLCMDQGVLGTLDLAHRGGGAAATAWIEPAGRIARLVTIALQNSLLVTEVQRLNALLHRENELLKDQIRETRAAEDHSYYVAESPAMLDTISRVRAVATSESTVLIRGETGAGKEGVARLVHELSARANGPFVVVNVGAIPETLIESELFGHERGAFTGAGRRRAGKFEQAAGGTLFLDEIGDAPLPVQVKLLRALAERRIHRLGGTEAVDVDVRVVAATNRNLEGMTQDGSFRTDLYYRLNVFPIRVPPLRERPEDIRPLTEHLTLRHAARMHRKPPRVSEPVIANLTARDWPGNVRELENFLERALLLSPGPELRLVEAADALPAPIDGGRGGEPRPTPTFDAAVRDLLASTLAETGGRIYGAGGAADVLGLKPTTLQGKLRKHGLDPARFRAERVLRRSDAP